LSLFNEKETWTYAEVTEKTQIPKNKLDAGLIMLCKPGVKLLEKQKNKPVFDDPTEIIKLNVNWSSNNILVRLVPIGAAKKTDGTEANQQQKIVDEISKERGAVIDGAIVKIMKTNKDAAVKH